jgi:hypothetical protein
LTFLVTLLPLIVLDLRLTRVTPLTNLVAALSQADRVDDHPLAARWTDVRGEAYRRRLVRI